MDQVTGKRLVELPKRKDVLIWLDLDEDERRVYDAVATGVEKMVDNFASDGDLMRNYAFVLEKLLRLRQICNHSSLLDARTLAESQSLAREGGVHQEGSGGKFKPSPLDKIESIWSLNLPIPCDQCKVAFSLDGPEWYVAPCLHIHCNNCLSSPLLPPEDRRIPEGMVWCKLCSMNQPKSSFLRGREYAHLRSKSASSMEGTPWKDASAFGGRSVDQQGLRIKVEEGAVAGSVTKDHGLYAQGETERYSGSSGNPMAMSLGLAEEEYKHGMDCVGTTTSISKSPPSSTLPSLAPGDRWKGSVKVRNLLEALINNTTEPQKEGEEDRRGKSIVFSQWTSTLDIIASGLGAHGLQYCRLDGTMTRASREEAISRLGKDAECKVMLVSLRAGGVGLNLTAARYVYLLEPYWNPAVEQQAVDRIHRIGQCREVMTVRYLVRNSVEERILEIQEEKQKLVEAAFREHGTRNPMEIINGSNAEETRRRRAAELRYMVRGGVNPYSNKLIPTPSDPSERAMERQR